MKREDVRRLFADATDEQVDSLLNAYHADVNRIREELRDANGRLAEREAALAAAQASEESLKGQVAGLSERLKATMSAEELLEQREAAVAEAERGFRIRSNQLDARSVLVSAGFDEKTVESLLPQIVSEDAEATKALAQAVAQVRASTAKATEESVRAAMLRENPVPEGAPAGTTGPASVEDFLKLPLAEQIRMKEADPGLLSRLK